MIVAVVVSSTGSGGNGGDSGSDDDCGSDSDSDVKFDRIVCERESERGQMVVEA